MIAGVSVVDEGLADPMALSKEMKLFHLILTITSTFSYTAA
jgi:hypothetical protein